MKDLKENLVKEINKLLRDNLKLFNIGNIAKYQNNCNYIKGLNRALELMEIMGENLKLS